ncbi:hypothetical protein TWF696_004591 [Orbilia brochopaga]|uniref:F-box domain-containing protein n=1 Tax=Orbilia brochopaga TaxID=3140254 RepID=A0AAV9V9J8_9PEZI
MSDPYRPFNLIPLELLHPIFQNLRRWDIASVALTCRSFNDAAKLLLWDDCDLTLFAGPPRPKPENIYYEFDRRRRDILHEKLNIISSKPMGDFIRSLTLRFDSEEKGIQAVGDRDGSDNREEKQNLKMARKFVDNAAYRPSVLRSLYVDMSFIFNIPLFAKTLQSLHLELEDYSCYVCGVRGLVPLPTFPNLKKLRITWTRFDTSDEKLNRYYPPLLTLVCQYLRRTPKLESFHLMVDRTDPLIQTYPVNSIAPMFPEDVEVVADSLFLPNLRRLDFALPQGLLTSTFVWTMIESGKKRVLLVEDLFKQFALRHTDIVERFLWLAMEENLPVSAKNPPRRSIPMLNAAVHMTIDRPCEANGLKNLRDLQNSHTEKLKSLQLYGLVFEVNEISWFMRNIWQFENLQRLQLHDWWINDDVTSAMLGVPIQGDILLGSCSLV